VVVSPCHERLWLIVHYYISDYIWRDTQDALHSNKGFIVRRRNVKYPQVVRGIKFVRTVQADRVDIFVSNDQNPILRMLDQWGWMCLTILWNSKGKQGNQLNVRTRMRESECI
jgi:hypothetical protein